MNARDDVPPDGGRLAWLQVVAGHLVILNSWGCVGSFGAFQTYYTSTFNRPLADISWIGSIQVFLLFFVGTISGSAADIGYFRHVFTAGLVLQILGLFMTSLSTRYWQLLLAQGVCLGVGNGLQFCPTVALVSTYFESHKATAIGLVASGSATGGIIHSLLVRELLPSIGFGWTLRVLGFTSVISGVLSLALLRPRISPRAIGSWIDLPAFKELPYCLYCFAMFLEFWGLYFVFFYIAQFGREALQLEFTESINYLIIMNAVAVPLRIFLNYLADRYFGALNSIIPFTFTSGVLVLIWTRIRDRNGLVAFAVCYGISAGGVQSLFPAVLASLNADLRKMGSRLGMAFTIVALAVLVGPSSAGLIIRSNDGNYFPAQVWGGIVMILGGLALIGARWAKVGWKICTKL